MSRTRLATLSSVLAATSATLVLASSSAFARSAVPVDGDLAGSPDALDLSSSSDDAATTAANTTTASASPTATAAPPSERREVVGRTFEGPIMTTPSAAVRRTSRPFRLEAGIGVRWGSFLVNNIDATDSVEQLHLDGGLRFRGNRTFVYAQYALQSMQIPIEEYAARAGTPVAIGNGRGVMHRFAAHARYAFARAGSADGGLDLYADVGTGVQHIRWDAGGAWTRPDLQIALGASLFGMGETQHGGMTFSMVFTLAPRNDIEGSGMACGGPCDYATQRTGVDRSFMFDVTVMFGR